MTTPVLSNTVRIAGECRTYRIAATVAPAKDSGGADSTCGSNGLLDYPHYTRPAEFRGMAVPEALMSGNHDEIRKWRRQRALEKTLRNRPDLLEGAVLSEEDNKVLAGIKKNCG